MTTWGARSRKRRPRFHEREIMSEEQTELPDTPILPWRMDEEHNCIAASSNAWNGGPDGSTINYTMEDIDGGGVWMLLIEGAELSRGSLIECMAEAQDQGDADIERHKASERAEAAAARLNANDKRRREIAADLAKTMQCNCDLDAWTPEATTGHSHVCRIHKETMRLWLAGQ